MIFIANIFFKNTIFLLYFNLFRELFMAQMFDIILFNFKDQ